MAENDETEIRTVGTRIVYQNRWMTVREDAILRADGAAGIYGVVERPDFVVVIPIEADGSVHLVEQYRYPVGARFWELPQGAWEHAPQADPLAVAAGELREETGLIAERLTHVGHLFPGCGYATQGYHVFLAQGLRQTSQQLDAEEHGLITECFAAETLVEMIRSGRIKDASTIAALGLARIMGLLDLPAGSAPDRLPES